LSDTRQTVQHPPPAEARLIGAHMPTSGGLYKSLTLGREIDCSAVQLFTCSPRQWNHATLKQEDVKRFLDAKHDTGIVFTVAHDSYLINLAAPSEEILWKSQAAFRSELERAEMLDIGWLVTHMGAHLDQGEDEALERLAQSVTQILDETDKLGYKVGIALETTAGQGTGLGWRFEQLGRILAAVGDHTRLGVCLDTCHVFVAGYDLRGQKAYELTWSEFDREIGYNKLKVIHANDAKKPLGSRVDRHEHIGNGEIGAEPFARLMTDPRLAHVPVIVETPDSDTMHAENVARLRRLASGQSPKISVTVQLYGHLSDVNSGEYLTLEMPFFATVADVAELLAKRDKRLENIRANCRFAVGEEYTDLTRKVYDGAVVAVLPPVSGG